MLALQQAEYAASAAAAGSSLGEAGLSADHREAGLAPEQAPEKLQLLDLGARLLPQSMPLAFPALRVFPFEVANAAVS